MTVLAIDQGTSSTKAVLVDDNGAVVASASAPVATRYPRPGWVEQDPDDIVSSVHTAAAAVLDGNPAPDAVGFSTQRESAVIWDRRTGRPLGPVLGWQDQRAHQVTDALKTAMAVFRPDLYDGALGHKPSAAAGTGAFAAFAGPPFTPENLAGYLAALMADRVP